MHVLKLDSDGLFFFSFCFVPRLARVPLCRCTHTNPTARTVPATDQNRMTWGRTRGPKTCPRVTSLPQPPLHSHLGVRRWKHMKDFFSPWDDIKSLAGGYRLFLRKKNNNGEKKKTNLKLLRSAWRWNWGSPGSNPNPAEVLHGHLLGFCEIWIGSSKQM